MIEERTEELAALYALGILTAEETLYFEDLLRHNPEVSVLLRDLHDTAASVAHLAPAIAPPPELRSRLLSAIKNETAASTPGKPKSDWFPWAMAAAIAVLAGVLAFARFGIEHEIARLKNENADVRRRNAQQESVEAQMRNELATLRSEQAGALRKMAEQQTEQTQTQRDLATLRTEYANALREIAQLHSQDELSKLRIATLSSKMKESPQTVGSVAWDGEKQRGVLTLEKIPPAGVAQDYQLWIIDPHYPQPVSGGIVHVDEHGDAHIVFKVEVPIHAADKFAVSRERKGGAPSAHGPIVMMGE